MGVQSFDKEIAQVPSQDCADRYFAPKSNTEGLYLHYPGCCVGCKNQTLTSYHSEN